MSEITFVTWDGGGNVPPALGIATELRDRGHRVRVLGHPSQADQFTVFDFVPYRRARAFRSTDQVKMTALLGVFGDRALGEDVVAELEARPADLVVVDCLLFGALDALARRGQPYVVLEHSLDGFLRTAAKGPFGLALRLRGLRPLPLIDGARVVVTTALAELDPGHGRCTHIGPVVRGRPAHPREPTVLISLSTIAYPALAPTWQRVLDAVDGLAARVVATIGPSLGTDRLRVPANVEVHRWLPHDEVLPEVSLVVGHGGHGTTMTALAHDVPVLVLPLDAKGDQPTVGRRVTEAGAGRTLRRRTEPARIRAAIEELLADGPHRDAAARLGSRIRELDGRTRGADLLASMVAGAAEPT